MQTTTCPEADRVARLYGFSIQVNDEGYNLCRDSDVYNTFPTLTELLDYLDELKNK